MASCACLRIACVVANHAIPACPAHPFFMNDMIEGHGRHGSRGRIGFIAHWKNHDGRGGAAVRWLQGSCIHMPVSRQPWTCAHAKRHRQQKQCRTFPHVLVLLELIDPELPGQLPLATGCPFFLPENRFLMPDWGSGQAAAGKPSHANTDRSRLA